MAPQNRDAFRQQTPQPQTELEYSIGEHDGRKGLVAYNSEKKRTILVIGAEVHDVHGFDIQRSNDRSLTRDMVRSHILKPAASFIEQHQDEIPEVYKELLQAMRPRPKPVAPAAYAA